MLYSIPVTNLVQGLSQQPNALKLPTQAVLAENCYPHVIDGLTKRPPTQLAGVLSDDDTGPGVYTHWVDRGGGERYVFSVSQHGIRAFVPDTGAEVPVIPSTEAYSGGSQVPYGRFPYLATINDTGLDTTDNKYLSMDWDVFSGSVTFGNSVVPRNPSGQFGAARLLVSEAHAPPLDIVHIPIESDVVDGRICLSIFVRAPETVDGDVTDAVEFFTLSWVSGSEYFNGSFNINTSTQAITYVSDDTSGPVLDAAVITPYPDNWYRISISADLTGEAVVDDPQEMRLTLQGQVGAGSYTLYVYGPKVDYGVSSPTPYFAEPSYRALTIGDRTFVTNRSKPVRMDADLSPANPSDEAIVYVRGPGAYNQEYRVTITTSEPFTYSWQCDVDVNADGSLSAGNDTQELSTQAIAEVLKTKIDAEANWTATRVGSVLHLTLLPTAEILSVQTSDGFGDTAVIGIWSGGSVRSFDRLPSIAVNGWVAKVYGDPGLAEDDQYYLFETEGGVAFGQGEWVETLAPGIPYAFDHASMPHQLVRMFDDNLGSITGEPLSTYFLWDYVDWTERMVGDEETNENPSFVSTADQDRGISNIFFYRGRLGFLSGEFVILSEAGEYENFWRTTVLVVPDSDPIDLAVTRTQQLALDNATEFQERLILVSKEQQFALTSEPILAPSVANIQAITDYEVTVGPAPQSTGRTLLVPYTTQNYSGVRELQALGDSTRYTADPITQEVPALIAGEIAHMASSTLESVMLVCTDASSDLYCYSWFWSGNEKPQSAWVVWKMDPAQEVLGLHFFEDRLFLLLRNGDKLVLEYIQMGREVTSAPALWQVHLDHLMTDADVAVTLVGSDTVIELPEPFVGDSNWVVLNRDSDGVIGEPYTVTVSSGDLVIEDEDLTSTDLWIGRKYAFRYQPTPAALKERQDNGGRTLVHDGRLMLKQLLVSYADTGTFSVRVTPVGRTMTERTLAPSIVGGQYDIREGVQRFGSMGHAPTTVVEFYSDSHLPVRLQTMEWVAEFQGNTRRYNG